MYKYVNGRDKKHIKFYIGSYPDASLRITYSVLCDDGTYTPPAELSIWGALVGVKKLHSVNRVYIDRQSFYPLINALKNDGILSGPYKKVEDDLGMFEPMWEYEFDEHFLSAEDHDNYLEYLKNLTRTYGLI